MHILWPLTFSAHTKQLTMSLPLVLVLGILLTGCHGAPADDATAGQFSTQLPETVSAFPYSKVILDVGTMF